MLRIYYTTSSGYNTEQNKVNNSLGGYKSSTPVPNDVFSNLFDEISLKTMSDPKSEYIGLILKNEGTEVLQNIEMWFEISENSYCDFLIGATKLISDEEGYGLMESIETIYSKPFYTELHSATVDNKVSIGDIQPNEEIGLWICRTFNKKNIQQDYDNVAEKDITTENRYKVVEKQKEESINFNISWQ